MKLINGNEGNILVAQHWLKKYHEDKEKGTVTPQMESKPMSIEPMSIEPMKIEIPKITPKVAAHSLITTKTGNYSSEQSSFPHDFFCFF